MASLDELGTEAGHEFAARKDMGNSEAGVREIVPQLNICAPLQCRMKPVLREYKMSARHFHTLWGSSIIDNC